MKKLFVAAVAAMTVLGGRMSAQALPQMSEFPFQEGEKVSYAVSYNWLGVMTDVAFGYMAVEDEDNLYHTTLFCNTAKFFDTFFKVHEDYESWFDGNLLPRKGTRYSHEGSYWARNSKDYHWEKNSVSVNIEKSTKGKKSGEVSLKKGTLDLPSILYYVRNADVDALKVGQKIPLTYIMDESITELMLTYKGIENKYLKGIGTVRCHKYGLTVVSDELFQDNDDASMWITDDQNRLIAYFIAPLKIGAVGGRMTGFEGVKYPFDSFVSKKKVK